MFEVKLCLAIIIAYLAGSVSSSILIGRIYGIDIRDHGSGNAGATNTLRTIGKKAGAMVLVIDLLKGILAVTIARYMTGSEIGASIAALSVMIGHNWPIFFGFKGGKGVATSAGALFTLNIHIGCVLAIVWFTTIFLTRYVSLSSVLAAISLPIATLYIDKNKILWTTIIAVIIVFRHRSNIGRLLNGCESKLGHKA